MPFTRVNPLKESSFWLSYLSSLHFNERASERTRSPNISTTKSVEDDRSPNFISKLIKTPPETLKSEQEKPLNIKTGQEFSRKDNRGSLQQEQLKAKVVAPKFMIFYDPSDPSDTSFVSSNYVKHWFPGLLVVPLPSYGIFGYVDFAFLAVLCYLNGSIIYVADSFLLWRRVNPNFHGDGSDPAIYLNTCGAGIFILNCLLCFLDWWIQYLELRRHHLATIDSFLISSNDESANKSIKKENDKGKAMNRFDSFALSPSSYYGLLNNFFFLFAAGLFFLQGLALQRQSRVASKSWFEFTVNFVGGLFYLLSSVFCCIESFEERANRSVQGLPRHNLFSFNFYDCDWFGWGDIIYFVASLTSLVEAFFIFFASEEFNCIFYIISNCLFLVDSIIYAIAYGLYLYDLRTSFFTGRIHASRTVSFSQLLAAESKLHDTKEGSLSSFQESPLQWKANDDGFVKIMDMHRSLYQSRIENQLNQRNMNQIDEIDENEEENQIELSTIPVQTSSKKISDEESAMWFQLCKDLSSSNHLTRVFSFVL